MKDRNRSCVGCTSAEICRSKVGLCEVGNGDREGAIRLQPHAASVTAHVPALIVVNDVPQHLRRQGDGTDCDIF